MKLCQCLHWMQKESPLCQWEQEVVLRLDVLGVSELSFNSILDTFSHFISVKCLIIKFSLLMSFVDTGNSSVQSSNACSDQGFTQINGRCGISQRQSPTSLRSPCVSPTTLFQSTPQHNAGNQGEKWVRISPYSHFVWISLIPSIPVLHIYNIWVWTTNINTPLLHTLIHLEKVLLSVSLNCLMYFS